MLIWIQNKIIFVRILRRKYEAVKRIEKEDWGD